MLASIGKKCPACGKVVQKTDGCNLMMCGTNAHGSVANALRNGGCAHIFNWETLKPMSDEHGYTGLDGKWKRGKGPKTERQVLLYSKSRLKSRRKYSKAPGKTKQQKSFDQKEQKHTTSNEPSVMPSQNPDLDQVVHVADLNRDSAPKGHDQHSLHSQICAPRVPISAWTGLDEPDTMEIHRGMSSRRPEYSLGGKAGGGAGHSTDGEGEQSEHQTVSARVGELENELHLLHNRINVMQKENASLRNLLFKQEGQVCSGQITTSKTATELNT